MQIKYCPSCGEKTFSNTNKKHWHCQICGFEYFHNMASAVAGIIQCGDEVLVTRRKFEPAQGLLDLPGGFVDYGESLEQALTRECYEELGVKGLEWQYLGSFANEYRYADVLYYTQDAFFVAQLHKKPHIIPQDDVAEATWVPANELDAKKIGFKSVQQGLQRWLQTRK